MKSFHPDHPRELSSVSRCPLCVDAIAYLSGKMRGVPFWNREQFEAAAKDLRAQGWVVHSPMEHDLERGLVPTPDGSTDDVPVAGQLAWDFERILESSCMIVLPGWETSTGVHWEMTVAHALDKPVLLYPDLTPVALPLLVRDPVALTPRPLPPMPKVPQESRITSSDRALAAVQDAGEWSHAVTDAFDKALTGEVRVVDPESGGEKGQKSARTDLLPADALMALAEHYGRGSIKYEDRNWERGYKWSLSYAALLRHLLLFWDGEDIDRDLTTGDFPHIVAAAWHSLALLTFYLRSAGTDDRPTGS